MLIVPLIVVQWLSSGQHHSDLTRTDHLEERKQLARLCESRFTRLSDLTDTLSSLKSKGLLKQLIDDEFLGATPLMSSAHAGRADMVEALLKAGANPKIYKRPERWTGFQRLGWQAIHFATSMPVVKCFVKHGVPLTTRTTGGQTLLHTMVLWFEGSTSQFTLMLGAERYELAGSLLQAMRELSPTLGSMKDNEGQTASQLADSMHVGLENYLKTTVR